MPEHLLVLDEEIRPNYPGDWDEKARAADAAGSSTRHGSTPWPRCPGVAAPAQRDENQFETLLVGNPRR